MTEPIGNNRRKVLPAIAENRRGAALTNLVRIVSTEFNFTKFKRSLSLLLPKSGNLPNPAGCPAPDLPPSCV
jgi:hypothetical protein